MYALMFALLSSAEPTATASPPAPVAPVTKKVCRDIEVPMSRMKRRVCQKVVVKQPAPEPPQTDEAEAKGTAPEPSGE